MAKKDSFTGFTPSTLDFLRDLANNNRKEWFEEHREEYRQCVQEPLQQLASALAGPLTVIDPDLITDPRRVISRIHRDTRFSRNKSPYKTTMWLTFKRPLKEWQDAPCFFFEIGVDFYRFGMGFYSASKGTMDRLRQVIDRKPDEFRRAVAFLAGQDTFALEGEKYKRLLDGQKEEDILEWYQRKNLYLVCNRGIDERLFSRRVLNDLTAGFGQLAPFYHWLWRLKVPER